MIDNAYALPPYPEDLVRLDYLGANAIEENLRYLILLFSRFDTEVVCEALGSLGYLELTETGLPAEGLKVTHGAVITRLIITVTGPDLTPLAWSGDGWELVSTNKTALHLKYDFAEIAETDDLNAALALLQFTATDDIDAVVTMAAESPDTHLDSEHSVIMLFRGGATWALLEDKTLTWETVEADELTWTGLEGLRK